MASNSQSSGDNDSPSTGHIPLQDLSRPDAPAEQRGRSPTSSAGLFSRHSLGRSRQHYHSISNQSPVDLGASRNPFESSSHAQSDDNEHDMGALAQAMSFGLNYEPGNSSTNPSALGFHDNISSLDNIPLDPYHSYEPDYTTNADPEDDTARLTDSRFLQPISGATAADGRLSNDSSFHSISFSDTSRLGDNLPHLESGLSHRSGSSNRSRSISPSGSNGALHRASSMVKSMSQRVVNLSNEPEVVQQSIEREESQKNARLDGPPALPALSNFAHDRSNESTLPQREKSASDSIWRYRNNPFRGRSLGIFGPNHPLRVWLCDLLVHAYMEPFILIVIIIQAILLIVESSESVFDRPREKWGSDKLDYVFLVIFVIYTLEITAKVIVSGFLFNPAEYSTLNRSLGLRKAIAEKGKNLIAPHRQSTTKKVVFRSDQQSSILRTFTGMNALDTLSYDDPFQKRRTRLAERAFLRHSFNRLDFVAVVSYWISFILALSGVEASRQIFIFRMMSSLRILRLLSLTNGTSIILRSLKRAAPLLVHVAFLIGFFWLLFAIVGIQSFKSSLRRTCLWVDPEGQSNFTLNDPYNVVQFCGGYLDNGNSMSWIDSKGVSSGATPKGYICPQGSLCIEGTNPYNGTMSFDNIFQSLELVFVVMTSNTFSDLLYYTADSDYLAAALYFACGIVILSLWLVNLLIAVITHSFQLIREESKRSAFAPKVMDTVEQQNQTQRKFSTIKRVYDKTEWLWICIIIFDLVVQALRSSTMPTSRKNFIDDTEIVVTIILLVEIVIRFASDWRMFSRKPRNWVDLALAIINCVILIPPIKNSGRAYTVLTLFQILRVYRVVLAFSVTRKLIVVVFRNTIGLLNLVLFLSMMTFLASIFATQLFRGQIPTSDPAGNTIIVTFSDIWNSFIGMYQILSSENWTTILYDCTNYTVNFNTGWISAAFLILWFIVANFIILNMFIAVIQESFDVSEDEKRLQQVRAFLEQKHIGTASQGTLALSKILRLGRHSDRYKDPLEHGPAALEMLLKDAVVHEFLDEEQQEQQDRQKDTTQAHTAAAMPEGIVEEPVQPGYLSQLWTKTTSLIIGREPNPFYSRIKFSRAYEELDPRTMAKEVVSAAEARKRAQREFLVKHPTYNKSLFIFAPHNPVRKLCQRIVGPGRGNQRVEGVDPYKPVWYVFSAFIYAAIVAMVILACITTPLYQRQYFVTNRNWFIYTDLGFAVVFTFEAAIKVIADGFFWTPNAYFRSSWGFIDGVVLITLWISVGSSLMKAWSISRPIGAFKALRALRLLNVSNSAKDTFHSVIILGGWKVVAAAAVSMSFLIPFAIYGVNLFNGQMISCNDGNFAGNLTYCVNEFASSPYNWDVLAPRVAANPYYDFDDFGDSLFILFQIVSQEGWIDVQQSAMSIVSTGMQPQDLVAPENGLFFIVFNLLGAVFVLTLFVSVFMRNYTEQTGVAFLTAEQRSWLELRKLLRQISPSKRSFNEKSAKWKLWCYRVAVKKHGPWATFVTCVLVAHLLLLVLEWYPEPETWELVRSVLFFIFMLVFVANLFVRLIGLGWHRFSRSSWDLYSSIAIPGAFVSTILNLSYPTQAVLELNKLFLVSIALLLIPRNNQLDQLFKTAAASLPVISNLLATWFVLFLVFGIALNQAFGLTKLGQNETNNLNFRDVPNSLILLLRTSVGEGWNQIMEDYATMVPPLCTYDSDFLNDDCGSAAWARSLFIAWNIISMYIFVSLFVSLIFESFSYVYQRSSGLYAVSREETRRFKQAWATFDPEGTGFITKEQFPRLLGELSGIFTMRIYDGEFSVGAILERCRTASRDSTYGFQSPNNMRSNSLVPSTSLTDGIDIKELASIIDRIPVNTIRQRRQRLNTFYEEILVSADPIRGISFHQCLMILAHYNVISDSKSLRLEEFLRRRARLQRVQEAVRRNTVVGFFDTLYYTREFRRAIERKKDARMTDVPQFTVPEIYVEDPVDEDVEEPMPGTMTPQNQPEIDGAGPFTPMLSPASGSTRRRADSSPTARLGDLPRLDTSATGLSSGTSTPTSGMSPSRTPRHMYGESLSFTSAGSPSQSNSNRSRQNSIVSARDVMDSLDNSVWGESIRRSFTQRRPNDRPE